MLQEPTAEDIKYESGCLATASLVSSFKLDHVSSLSNFIVILLEVLENLACPLVQGHCIWLGWTGNFKCLSHFLCLRGSFYLGPKPCNTECHV